MDGNLENSTSGPESCEPRRPAPVPFAPRRRRPRAAVWIAVGLGAAAVAAVVWTFSSMFDRRRGPKASDCAEAFVQGLCLGEGGDPRNPEDRRSGYGMAYERLADQERARCDFSDFCADFAIHVDRYGPIVMAEPMRPSKGADRREFRYRLGLGRPSDHRDDLVPMELVVRIDWGANGTYQVTAYHLAPERESERK